MLYWPLPPKEWTHVLYGSAFPPWLMNKNLPERLISKQTSTREWQLIPQRGWRKSYFPSQEKKGRAWVIQRKVQRSRTDRKHWHVAGIKGTSVPVQLFETQSPWSLSHLILWPLLWENSKVMVDGSVSEKSEHWLQEEWEFTVEWV